MASEFIGLQMLVTVRGVPPVRFKGTVSAVEAGAGLTLSNVWRLDTNDWKPRLTIPSANIVDLSEIPPSQPPPPVVPPPVTTSQRQPPQHQLPPLVTKQPLVDPAILAVGRPPAAVSGPPSSSRPPQPHLPNTSEKRDAQPAVAPPVQPVAAVAPQEAISPATLAASVRGLKLDAAGPGTATIDSPDEDNAEPALDYNEMVGDKTKNRRRQRKPKPAKTVTQEDYEPTPAGTATTTPGRGKGWRQTPILQSTASFQPFSSLKRNRKGRLTADNGWASEDVTDVQEMGDFDFEGGLAKFDKQNLFAQMRKNDQIDEADRLVSHNRLPRPKPGTAGGKNLHHTENVLDMPSTILKPSKDGPKSRETPNDFWNSEADDGVLGSERLSGRDQGMGSRQSSRRGESKGTAGRRSQSRKAHAAEAARAGSGPSRNSGVSDRRSRAAQAAKGSRPSSRLSSRATATADKRKQLPNPVVQQSLHVLPSNRRIETVSPLQMFNLENIAHSEIGLTEEMMTENAGRGIAEVALTALSDPAIKVRHAGAVDPTTGGPPPQTVVVLAGNNKSGTRAVAAARHLRNKGINVLVCVAGLERGERDLLEDVQQQVLLYRNLGGRVFTKSELFDHIRKISIPILSIDAPRTSLSSLANPAPVMLIIDALLGLAISFEELRNGDQATVYELIEWANRNEAFVLAVDVPSGVDPTSGKVSVVDGHGLYVKPRYVVAVGAPKRGLLEALIAADNEDADAAAAATVAANAVAGDAPAPDDAVLEWKLYLVDMGLGQAVWKKAGTKMRKGVDFGDKWVLEMKYRGIPSEEEDDDEEEE
ncbi:hypothetical protein VTJ49DRAFT_79 [Mycothermus thermophilus]|uniref:Enhancer of mRNA-decapping protein 3 n=1 Tax=Humicola insolens TaxID=85995 RepID=A0ABR3VRW9_HUMIN